jgi:hypothetical protein
MERRLADEALDDVLRHEILTRGAALDSLASSFGSRR